jgi:AAA15 family ATPase/GTPase
MIKELKISNYKSILIETIELSNVNVFIGENGCGKTNILESVAMLSAALDSQINSNILTSKGVRIAKPLLTMSSFIGRNTKKEVAISAKFSFSNEFIDWLINPVEIEDIFSDWKSKIDFDEKKFDPKILDILKSIVPVVEENLQFDIDQEINEAFNGIKLTSNPDLDIDRYKKEIKSKFFREIKTQGLKRIIEKSSNLSKYIIFNVNTQSLRGIIKNSNEIPLGINGEGLDVLLNDFSKEEWIKLKEYSYLITWLDDILIDESDSLKYQGHKLGRSSSFLYFKDKFMRKNNNVFAAENSNEGVLNILFYLALFISRKTPKFFAIDNIESSLNPKLCRTLMKIISELAVEQNKQVLITTHNPAILDGMNLFDENQRLFVVKRSDEGDTRVERIKLKPEVQNKELKLSEMWMRGYLGGIPNNF